MSVLRVEQKWNVSKARGEIREKGRLGQLLGEELLKIIDDLCRQLERFEKPSLEMVRKQRPAAEGLQEKDGDLGTTDDA